MTQLRNIPIDLAGSPVTPQGLDLVDKAIENVITTITTELGYIKPAEFEADGHIAPASFGRADRAASIALHHTRAHGVVVDTLSGVKTDLENFQVALQSARDAVLEADQTTADELRLKQVAVTALTTGSRSDEGDRAYNNAQHNHRNDVPKDEA
jgi:hypothetical protein